MKTLLIPVMCVVLLGCQLPTSRSPEPRVSVESVGNHSAMDGMFIGIVESGKLKVLLPKSPPGNARFTRIGMQAAISPEAGELNLAEYEGTAIAIQGHYGGDWIYSARVIDKAGPIVTALVEQVLGQ